jgi:hypothetical protein
MLTTGGNMRVTDSIRVAILGAVLLLCAACDFDAPQSSELAERDAIANQVTALLKNERFEDLDTLADSYRSGQARTSSGLWKLSLFYFGLEKMLPRQQHSPEIWALLGQPVEHWIERRPESPTAHLAYATMLINQAWGIRGTGYAKTVPQPKWEPFHAKVEEARAYLERVKFIASIDPQWYTAMLDIATLQDWPEAKYPALLAEGLDRHPLYYEMYFSAIYRNLPKWGGDAEKVEAIARNAVERTRASEGSGLYARIYWVASASQFGDDLFETSRVDWAEMKRGIDDVLAQYPDDWNLNHFAKFACLAGDHAKAAELIDRIEGEPLPAVWGASFYLERCRLLGMIAG